MPILWSLPGSARLMGGGLRPLLEPAGALLHRLMQALLDAYWLAKKENRKEADYHVSMDRLNTGTPTELDLTMEEAAQKGAQYLESLYGLDLEGAYVYMMYSPGTVTFPRAFWCADVLF